MTIAVYTPGLSVTLIKLVDRKDGVAGRALDATREIDLTFLLGDSGTVQTTKSLHGDPAGGFSFSFADQPDPETDDTYYARIEPMDMIEIRAARDPASFNGTQLPLLMRGFVTNVRRSESMGEDGTPRRAVLVTGHDFGKLWQIHAVWNERLDTSESGLLGQFALQAYLQIGEGPLAVEDFVRDMVEKAMNAKVADMEEYSGTLIPRFTTEISVTQGQLMPSIFANIGNATYWQIVSSICDEPWNELFIREDEDGPVVVFRPAPYKDIDSNAYIMANDGAKDPGSIDVDISEVVQWDVSRSDARVANFYWVPPEGSSLDTDSMATTSSLVDGSALDFQHGNNAPQIYGEKKMTVSTSLTADDSEGLPSSLSPSQRQAESDRTVAWYRKRAQQLQAMNRDNSVLEDGGAVVMGREDYTIGTYLRLIRGELLTEAYVTAVSHTIPPLSPWTTTLALERGTGLLSRLKLDSDPYYGEGRQGPYST